MYEHTWSAVKRNVVCYVVHDSVNSDAEIIKFLLIYWLSSYEWRQLIWNCVGNHWDWDFMGNRLNTDLERYIDFVEKRMMYLKIMCGKMTRENFYLQEKYEMFYGGSGWEPKFLIYRNHRTIRKSGYGVDYSKCLGFLLMPERNILLFKIACKCIWVSENIELCILTVLCCNGLLFADIK